MWNVKVRVSPGFIETRSNPRSSLIGRVTELTSSRTYNCTTSSPMRVPALVTSTDTFALPFVAIEFGSTRKLLY